jgi:acyl-CoA dehydrogenase
MQLVLTEDQKMLAETATNFVSQHSPISRMRKLRDGADPVGYSLALWKQMAELGWPGIPFPEATGGLGLGLADLAVVLEALGAALAPEPFVSTVLLGGQAILLGGTDAQSQKWLPKIVDGSAVLALAYQEERSRYDLHHVTTRAERDGDGWRLFGTKLQVLDGHRADALVVSARTSGASSMRKGSRCSCLARTRRGWRSRGKRAWTLATRRW